MKKTIAKIKKIFKSMTTGKNSKAINPMSYYIVNRSIWAVEFKNK